MTIKASINTNNVFRLGKIQKSILILLWDSERYGLEILSKLKFNGINITASQLYPALNKLESNNLLNCRTESRIGANRKYYSISKLGREAVNNFVEESFSIIAELIVNRTDYYFSVFKDLIEIKLEDSLLDLNVKTSDDLIREFSYSVGTKGVYNCVNFILEDNVFDERIKGLGLNNVNFVQYSSNKLNLSDSSCDIIVAMFFFHSSSYYSIIPELNRVLKKNGIMYIIDIEQIENNLLLDLITSLINDHPVFGVNIQHLEILLNNTNLKIVETVSRSGLIFLKVKPN